MVAKSEFGTLIMIVERSVFGFGMRSGCVRDILLKWATKAGNLNLSISVTKKIILYN